MKDRTGEVWEKTPSGLTLFILEPPRDLPGLVPSHRVLVLAQGSAGAWYRPGRVTRIDESEPLEEKNKWRRLA